MAALTLLVSVSQGNEKFCRWWGLELDSYLIPYKNSGVGAAKVDEIRKKVDWLEDVYLLKG